MPDEAIQIHGLSFLQVIHGRCINYFQPTVFCGGAEQTVTELIFIPGQLCLPNHTSPFIHMLRKSRLSHAPDVNRVPRITGTIIKNIHFPSCERKKNLFPITDLAAEALHKQNIVYKVSCFHKNGS